MFFPQNPWWHGRDPRPPDALKYATERWWELLRDWHCTSYYQPRCSYAVSLMRDVATALDDLQSGAVRSSHHLEGLKQELETALTRNELVRKNFPSEVTSTQNLFKALFHGLPPDPQNRYAELKKRRMKCRRCAMAARRLHDRMMKRRVTVDGLTVQGLGGIAATELLAEVSSATPRLARIDRLLSTLLLDCVYRGYDLDYLASLFDRFLGADRDVGEALRHLISRLQSRRHHTYTVYYVLDGATSLSSVDDSLVMEVDGAEIDEIADDERWKPFHAQRTDQSVVIAVVRDGDPDAGAAAEAARRQVQEIVDYLDFREPAQQLHLAPQALVRYSRALPS